MTDEERARSMCWNALGYDSPDAMPGDDVAALAAFAAAVRADATKLEREACAKVADDVADDWERSEGAMGGYYAGKDCAGKIRARKP